MLRKISKTISGTVLVCLAFSSCSPAEPAVVDSPVQTSMGLSPSEGSTAPTKSVAPTQLAPSVPTDPPSPELMVDSGDIGVVRSSSTVQATDEQFLRALIEDVLQEQSVAVSQTDTNYFVDGSWVTGDSGCLRCDIAPAVAAATLAALYGDDQALGLAVASGDTFVANHVQPDGSFGPPDKGEGGNDIQTALGATALGQMWLLMEGRLDPEHRAAWGAAVTGAADFLIGNGNLEWYSNGNIVLANTLTMALAYRISNDAKYLDAYETAWQFSLSPSPTRWPGYGWIDTQGSLAAGGENAGYFTEKGVEPGYDPEYTMMQANVAVRLYLVTGDPRALNVTNALLNQVMPRVDTADWSFDTSGGTRHTESVRRVNFDVSALVAMVNLAGRSDLESLVPLDLAARDRVSRQDAYCAGKGTYYSYIDLASRLISYSPGLVRQLQGEWGVEFGAVNPPLPSPVTRTWQVTGVERPSSCA